MIFSCTEIFVPSILRKKKKVPVPAIYIPKNQIKGINPRSSRALAGSVNPAAKGVSNTRYLAANCVS
jgi:hypothetical protein